MHPSTADCRTAPDKCRIDVASGHYKAGSLTINNLLIFLSNAVERVVVDRTGLKGSYEVEVDYAVEPSSDKPSIFTAVQEQLGLRLESERGAVDVVVIDHIERPAED